MFITLGKLFIKISIRKTICKLMVLVVVSEISTTFNLKLVYYVFVFVGSSKDDI